MKISGISVAIIVGAALVATLVLPPAGALWLNHRRVASTVATLGDVAEILRRRGPADPGDAGRVHRGSGRWPDLSEAIERGRDLDWDYSNHRAWLALAESTSPAGEAGWAPDAWSNCIFVLSRTDGYLVVSAGANGLIETPTTADVPGGDDLAMRVRWP